MKGGEQMKNVKVDIRNKKLVISIPLEKPRPSKSAKTFVVASTGGVKHTDVEIEGCPVYINVNAFIYPEQEKNDQA
jgi:hypothetical protein